MTEPEKGPSPSRRTVSILVGVGASVLICIGLASTFLLGGAEPAPEFLSRRLCTYWAGNCQPYQMTAGGLAEKLRRAGSVQWEVLGPARSVLRCHLQDPISKAQNEVGFLLDANDQSGQPFAAVSQLSINGEALSPAEIVNMISAIVAP